MEQLNRMNRPAPAGGQVPVQAPAQHGGAPKKKKPNLGAVAKIAAVAAIVVALVALLFVFVLTSTRGISSEIKTDKYQAVFLNSADGQVYFGKLAELNGDYYKLTDIYYVRVEQVQPNPNEQAQQNISLAKLGNEIHGPEDVMYIRKDHVMFWENLKDDGQVVTAIREYQKNGGNTNTNTNNNASGSEQSNN
jgi:hypothetical protein